MIDLNALTQLMPLTINDFKQRTSEQIEKNKIYLTKVWLNECAEIIKDNKEYIETLIAQNEQVSICHPVLLAFSLGKILIHGNCKKSLLISQRINIS